MRRPSSITRLAKTGKLTRWTDSVPNLLDAVTQPVGEAREI
jgi:hypothetical protein